MPPSMPPAFHVDSLQLNLQGSPIVVINKLILYTCPPCKHGDKMNVGAMWLAFGLAPKSGDRHTQTGHGLSAAMPVPTRWHPCGSLPADTP